MFLKTCCSRSLFFSAYEINKKNELEVIENTLEK